jgi:hypothetical protein
VFDTIFLVDSPSKYASDAKKSCAHIRAVDFTLRISLDPLLKSHGTSYILYCTNVIHQWRWSKACQQGCSLACKGPNAYGPPKYVHSKFTIAQSEDCALQMWVHHAFDITSKNSNGLEVSMSTVTTSSTTMSSISQLLAGEFVPIPEQKELLLTAVAKVKSVNNKKELGVRMRAALKQATLL